MREPLLNQTHRTASMGRKPRNTKSSALKAGRMPRLPAEHKKVIIRPNGGLNIATTPSPSIASAVIAAAGIKKEDAKEDILSLNAQQHIIITSSPSMEHTKKYVQIKHLITNNETYEVNTYVSAPEQTSKGVIRGIPLEFDETTESDIVNHRNPLALAARRLGNTPTIIITFDGMKVPRTVFYDLVIMCALYRKQIDICHQCGRLGHRMDVCPFPTNRLCRGCRTRNPGQDHKCEHMLQVQLMRGRLNSGQDL
ncbi:hypothetical protein HPB50_021111 [Hyalomma asiaticum]|uniref:Uncharacterized protein n=1 Tax=Hyalomma asiaticum TaxID=266040 RepID=A0ACB7TS78_HYAAI|nr:hypothetical protein HPB50_021111 [Hyalomma asiaticum]